MSRVVSAAGLLLAVAAMAAGCGGASLQSIARNDSKEFLSEPHPRFLSLETVRIEDGELHVVARLEGHFRFDPTCPAQASGSKRNCGTFWTHYADLEFSLTNREFAGYWSSSAAAEKAYTAARRASPRFRIFPDFSNLLIQCTIPGGWGGSVAGTCSTEAGARRVEFEEHWPLSRPGGTRYHATWLLTLAHSGQVLSVHFSGDKPPQLWTTSTQPPVPPESVSRARHELRYLKSFPRFPGTALCSIAAGGLGPHTLHGTCTTKVLAPVGNRPRLEFLERWPRGRSGGWIVTLRHDDRVLTVRITGSNPPQSWR